MKAIICKNMKKPDGDIVNDVVARLRRAGVEADFSEAVHADCDVIITIGGDGTILHHGKAAAKLGKPLLGINTGRLGFMTSLELKELDLLERLAGQDWQVCSRMMLDVQIGADMFPALNDAVFYKDVNSKLPEFKVSADGFAVSEIRADGLILSTPTGSTAYALSAGGPIIVPWVDCIEFVPLCAHSLFGRPMILSAEKPVTVEFEGISDTDSHSVFVSIDGEAGIPLQRGQSAAVRKSALRLSLIDLKGGSFYNAVHNKLMKPLK